MLKGLIDGEPYRRNFDDSDYCDVPDILAPITLLNGPDCLQSHTNVSLPVDWSTESTTRAMR